MKNTNLELQSFSNYLKLARKKIIFIELLPKKSRKGLIYFKGLATYENTALCFSFENTEWKYSKRTHIFYVYKYMGRNKELKTFSEGHKDCI